MLDGHDDGFGKAIAFSVVNVPFSGKEVAQGASDLSLNMAEAMLLLWGFDFAVNCQLAVSLSRAHQRVDG
jgi:hypothetical protein